MTLFVFVFDRGKGCLVLEGSCCIRCGWCLSYTVFLFSFSFSFLFSLLYLFFPSLSTPLSFTFLHQWTTFTSTLALSSSLIPLTLTQLNTPFFALTTKRLSLPMPPHSSNLLQVLGQSDLSAFDTSFLHHHHEVTHSLPPSLLSHPITLITLTTHTAMRTHRTLEYNKQASSRASKK